eukprot:5880308-Pleurochrysis_carterae.AAC.1
MSPFAFRKCANAQAALGAGALPADKRAAREQALDAIMQPAALRDLLTDAVDYLRDAGTNSDDEPEANLDASADADLEVEGDIAPELDPDLEIDLDLDPDLESDLDPDLDPDLSPEVTQIGAATSNRSGIDFDYLKAVLWTMQMSTDGACPHNRCSLMMIDATLIMHEGTHARANARRHA